MKPQKAMTDDEIINEYDECHIGIEEVIKIAREQGRADLLKEQKDKPKRNYRMVNRRKALRF